MNRLGELEATTLASNVVECPDAVAVRVAAPGTPGIHLVPAVNPRLSVTRNVRST